MSAFEVTITPSRLKNKKCLEGREPTSVVMAPFSSKAIVTFEDVPVSKTAKRILKIYNPSQDPIEVKVTKPIRAEHNVTIDWTTNLVPAEDEIEMEMVWSPTMEIACKDTLQLTDNRNFRKDVMVILKSFSNKPVSKNVKRYPTISSALGHGKTLRLKSPAGPKPNTQSQQRRNRQPTNYKAQKTERISPVSRKHQPQRKLQISPLFERNVPEIVVNKAAATTTTTTTVLPSQSFTRCQTSSHMFKENVSPLTPGNILDVIDNMQFTPANNTASKKQIPNELDYLSSLPTPINRNSALDHSVLDETNLIRQIQPRRLTVAVESSEDEMSPMHMKVESIAYYSRITVEKEKSDIDGEITSIQTQVINNKTFDLKLFDKSDSLSESQESFESACDKIVLNKTATLAPSLSRPLSMIEEEDSPQNVLQKTYEISKLDEQLKRDIKLVGTPLRKYSESMKDLSLKSPLSKISIQGSMPNLNEMECIRSIEQNRYFYAPKSSSNIEKQYSVSPNLNETENREQDFYNQAAKTASVVNERCHLRPKAICLDDSDVSNSSLVSCTSQADLLFNQNEILAQSSRFNLNEIGKKSRKNSPVSLPPGSSNRKSTPTKPARKLLQSPAKSVGYKRYRDSPGSDTSTLGVPKVAVISVSPPKRAKIECDPYARMPSSGHRGQWPQVHPKKPKLARTLALVKKPLTPRKIKEEPIVKLYDSEMYMQSYINPDPFAATTTRDPFLASTMYLDERSVDRHQAAFKKWLNALVSIPADLDADCNLKIDVGRLFNEVRNKELILAPTKEEQSMNYLTKFRLESLRQEAIRFFMSEEMQIPCSKVAVYVHKNAIRIRTDRNLHLDVVMQRYILELLLCFNPLWLRLGLEVVFAEKIHLHSCSDVVGLSTFIVNRLFKDKFIEQKFSKAYTLSDEYADHIKKFTLQKVLFLLLFLDKAKTKRIIKHNPCLFVKKSPHKEAREILLKFSCELLANIGDITRDLKRLGYVLTHKQNFLDEFNYAFNNLAVDLRDGIRLTRVMEVILLRDNLSKQLRVPAISRLQRIYNVNLSLRALADANFQLKGEITAADIVDGHREKTLSLLWQIIYKFRSPKFHAAATVIQRWWRNSWLLVCIRRRIRIKIQKRRNAAATLIQSAFRGYMSRKYIEIFRSERTSAAVCLQKYTRRYLTQKQFIRTVKSVLHIQRWYRALKYGITIRQRYVVFRNQVTVIQRWIRRIRFAHKLEQAAPIIRSIMAEAQLRHEKAITLQRYVKSVMLRRKFRKLVCDVVTTVRSSKLEFKSATRIQSFCKMAQLRREFKMKREAVCKIQEVWRGFRQMKVIREQYILKQRCVLHIQRSYRSFKLMQKEREEYLKLRSTVVMLQSRIRTNKLCSVQRTMFVTTRQSVIVIQEHFRATLLMRKVRSEYQRQRSALIRCQQRFRATLAMRTQLAEYMKIKSAAICFQQRYRAHLQMRQDRAKFQKTISAIVRIQQKLRATLLARKIRAEYIRLSFYAIVIQQRFRARKQMRIERSVFLHKRTCVIQIQRAVRASQQMKIERNNFMQLRQSTLIIQRKFRANLAMRLDRSKFCEIKSAAICIQQRVRQYLLMKKIRFEFLAKKRATILIQRRFRAHQTMKTTRAQYVELQRSAVRIQKLWRAKQEMKATKASYENSRRLIIAVQRRFRAKLLGRQMRQTLEIQRAAIIRIQRRFRANRVMKQVRKAFEARRAMIVQIQLRFRSYIRMKEQRKLFVQQRRSIVNVQRWFRSILCMRRERNSYLHTRACIVSIQCHWRATVLARKQRTEYLHLRSSVMVIQKKWQATLTMRKQQSIYQIQKRSVIVLQRHYRARLKMLNVRSQYLLIVSLIVCIQRKFRANRAMKAERQKFLQLKRTTIFIQEKFRGRIRTAKAQEKFSQIRKVALGLQTAARGFLARKRFEEQMTPEMQKLIAEKKAARIIQRFWRGYRVRKRWQNVRILTIRHNIKKLQNTTDVVKTIRWKVQDSVRILRGRWRASDALNVLLRLERMSRIVPHLLMGHSDFISTFCYGIMAQAIRSEVDKQLIEYCSCVILNLARYNSTTAKTFQEGGLVTIAQMLLRWCDKDCNIFNTLCTLIWVFSHCPEKRKKIREFMTTAEAIYVVRETKKLVARKEKMRQNIRKPVLSSSIYPRNLQQGIVFSSRALPSLEPDYGVIRNKPYTFISSVYAFDTILLKLNIDIRYC